MRTSDFIKGKGLVSSGRFSGRSRRCYGRTASFVAIFVILTSIHGRDYTFHIKCGLDSELNGSVSRAERKSKFLYPTFHMPIEFKDILDVFKERDLLLPKLNVLVPDAHFYETFAIQPGGEIAARPDFIGHGNQIAARSQFSDFLRLAFEKDCDLVLSPEYSCPWEVLTNALAHQSLPRAGKIWMLGCEAITSSNLQAVISAHPDVVWIHEPIPDDTSGFLDVLAYVTKAEGRTDGMKNVIVLQFKTQPMGGDTFERDHLICGERIYIWHNPQDNIRLISLICSEALTFDPAAAVNCRFDLHPYLIFHPQLNEDPRHPEIRPYRDRLFGWRVSDRIEVLTLNWARGFTLPNRASSQYGGSAIYTKSPEFELSDTRLEANHQKGLFYSFWHAHRTDLCFFSFDQHVFHYRMPKTLQDVPAVLAQRTGPEMLSLWHWDAQTGTWRDAVNADDGFAQLCGSFQQQGCDYCSNAPHKAVDRERLLTLSAGKLRRARDWHTVRNMDSFKAEADERSKRLTFTHEQAQASDEFRRGYLRRYIKLQMTVLANPANFPPTIQDLVGDWSLQPPSTTDGFRFNLVSRSARVQGATAIFLGLESPDSVHRLMDDLLRAWDKPEETRRLVIWYESPIAILCLHPPLFSITNGIELPASITHSTTP